jgi:hypothetical protein
MIKWIWKLITDKAEIDIEWYRTFKKFNKRALAKSVASPERRKDEKGMGHVCSQLWKSFFPYRAT